MWLRLGAVMDEAYKYSECPRILLMHVMRRSSLETGSPPERWDISDDLARWGLATTIEEQNDIRENCFKGCILQHWSASGFDVICFDGIDLLGLEV
eukprot:1229708-Ditylum_brightwellii.AAC.1